MPTFMILIREIREYEYEIEAPHEQAARDAGYAQYIEDNGAESGDCIEIQSRLPFTTRNA